MFNKMTYLDGCTIEPYRENGIAIESNGSVLYFDATDKPCFDNKTGEVVMEYSGLAVDDNSERSWAKANYIPGGFSPAHYHQEHTEHYYIVSGQAKVILDGQEKILSVGDDIEIQPTQTHQVINASDSESLSLIVKCMPAWTADDYHLLHITPRP